MDPQEAVAALRRAQESAKALKTRANLVSDPTVTAYLDNILDSCSFALSILTLGDSSRRSYKKRSREEVFKHYRDDSPTLILDDGFSWRKYGQKFITNSPHQRSYYQCRYGGRQSNCEAKKQVQKIQDDPPVFRTTYIGHHTCQNVAVSVPVENSNMIQFHSHDRQETVDQEEEEGNFEQFLNFDLPALTEEEMKFFDNIFVSE